MRGTLSCKKGFPAARARELSDSGTACRDPTAAPFHQAQEAVTPEEAVTPGQAVTPGEAVQVADDCRGAA